MDIRLIRAFARANYKVPDVASHQSPLDIFVGECPGAVCGRQCRPARQKRELNPTPTPADPRTSENGIYVSITDFDGGLFIGLALNPR